VLFRSVIDYIRDVMADPRINPQWLQIPIKLFNATSATDPWLMCWEPGKEWMRAQEPGSIKENIFGTDRFGEMFNALPRTYHPNAPAVRLAGVRCSESPGRMKGLTSFATYKDATWGRAIDKKRGHYAMYPLYDWSDSDVWKAIHAHGWAYCPIYDAMFQYGVPLRAMRVSNLHHETAISVLYYVQEIERETWNKLTRRLAGINSAGHLKGDMFSPKELPWMFRDWVEYRDFLLEKLIPDEAQKANFRKMFASADGRYEGEKVLASLHRLQVGMILVNDWEGIKMQSFAAANGGASKTGGSKGALKFGRFLPGADAAA
jgi:predicted phosphoadenosine phosphosulfate sulfurtransferase